MIRYSVVCTVGSSSLFISFLYLDLYVLGAKLLVRLNDVA